MQAAAVVALGALAAALIHAANEYFVFLGQVLRLAGSDDRWLGGPSLSMAAELSGGGVIVVAAVVGIAVQGACGYAAWLAYRRGHVWLARAVIAVSALALVAQATCALHATQNAIVRVHAASSSLAADRLSDSVRADGYRVLVAGPAAAIAFALPQLLLALGACACALAALQQRAAARRARELLARSPSAAQAWRTIPGAPIAAVRACATLLCVLGLLPFAGASLWYFGALNAAFDAMTRVDAYEKMPILLGAVDAGQRALAFWTRVAIAGVALASAFGVVVLVVLPWRRRAALCADAANAAPRLSVAPLLLAASAWLASAALVELTAPYRAENARPVQPGAAYLLPGGPVPPYDGPDPLELAPVLETRGEHVALDWRTSKEPSVLRSDLETVRRNWSILHADQPPPTSVRWVCTSPTQLAVAIAPLRVAHETGYTRVSMVVGRWISVHRPLLGVFERPQFSAATAELVLAESAAHSQSNRRAEGATLTLDARASCETLARDLVALRNAGRNVRLVLP